MSVFEEHICTNCRKREAQENKPVCRFCERRYNSKGKAYILACDIYHYRTEKGRAAKVWVCDGLVNQIHCTTPGELNHLIGMTEADINKVLPRKGYKLEYKSEKVF